MFRANLRRQEAQEEVVAVAWGRGWPGWLSLLPSSLLFPQPLFKVSPRRRSLIGANFGERFREPAAWPTFQLHPHALSFNRILHDQSLPVLGSSLRCVSIRPGQREVAGAKKGGRCPLKINAGLQ